LNYEYMQCVGYFYDLVRKRSTYLEVIEMDVMKSTGACFKNEAYGPIYEHLWV